MCIRDRAKLIARYGDNKEDFRKAGLEFAMNQVSGLMANGVQGIHLYTMNKAEEIIQIIRAVSYTHLDVYKRQPYGA